MNQNYNCCDNTNTCGCGCNSQEGHWECTEVKPPVAPLTPELVKAFYEANPNTEAFTTINKAQLALLMTAAGNPGSGTPGTGNGTVNTIVAGKGIAVDATDPANPIVSSTGTGGGATGAQGPQGVQGHKGDQGVVGATGPAGHAGKDGVAGPQGPQGVSWHLEGRGTEASILTKTGVPGDMWIVEGGPKDGHAYGWDPLLKPNAGWRDMGQFKGDKGDKGHDGAKGLKGDAGNTGPKGADGSVGAVGPKGSNGAKGNDGTGVTIKGSDTAVNIKAKTGPDAVVGVMWLITDPGATHGHGLVSNGKGTWTDVGAIQGPKGDKGHSGAIGVPGAKGADGITWHLAGRDTEANIVAKPGAAGDIWLITEPGKPHDGQAMAWEGKSWVNKGQMVGDTGPAGHTGAKGTKGDTGKPGPIGPIGHPGADGKAGANGHVGTAGPQGVPGLQGKQGLQGPSIQSDWDQKDSKQMDFIKNKPTTNKPRVDAADVLPPLADVKPGDIRFIRDPKVHNYPLSVLHPTKDDAVLYTKGATYTQQSSNADTRIEFSRGDTEVYLVKTPFDVSSGMTIVGIHIPASEIHDYDPNPANGDSVATLEGPATTTLVTKMFTLTAASPAAYSVGGKVPFREYVATEHAWADITPTVFSGEDFSREAAEDEKDDVFIKTQMLLSSYYYETKGKNDIMKGPGKVQFSKPSQKDEAYVPSHLAEDTAISAVPPAVSQMIVILYDSKTHKKISSFGVDSVGTLRINAEKLSAIQGIPLDLSKFRELGWSTPNNRVYSYEDKVTAIAIYNKIKGLTSISAKAPSLRFVENYVYDGIHWEAYGEGTISIVPGSNGALRSITKDLMHGLDLTRLGEESFAVGGANASGHESVAFCNGNAMGYSSVAIGSGCNAEKNGSMAFGDDVTVSANNAIAIGKNVIATVDESIVLGKNNATVTDSKLVLIVGAGEQPSPSQLKNAIEVYSDKAVKLPGFTAAEVAKDPKNAATVEYVKSIVPAHPTADGEYKLKVAAGVATWVKI